jgi:hypothetical protein
VHDLTWRPIPMPCQILHGIGGGEDLNDSSIHPTPKLLQPMCLTSQDWTCPGIVPPASCINGAIQIDRHPKSL